MAVIDFGGVTEEVVTREEFPMSKALDVLRNETIAVIGYGVQGPAQSLNMKDNGFNVIVGQAKKFEKDWNRAVDDGWEPGKTLFDIEEACKRGQGGYPTTRPVARWMTWAPFFFISAGAYSTLPPGHPPHVV